MSKRRFPITVKRGNVSVKVYRTPSNGCQAFTVAYYFGGQRVRKTFADLARAELEAETVANRICAGELNVLTLTSEVRLVPCGLEVTASGRLFIRNIAKLMRFDNTLAPVGERRHSRTI